MKKYNILILIAFISILWAGSAIAEPKPTPLGWWPGHETWVQYKGYNPYLEKGKATQNPQWAGENWFAEDWIAQHEDSIVLVSNFFKSGIFVKADDEKGVPVLLVGPSFYRLSGLDKRKVVTTMDVLYGITQDSNHPVILLKDWHTKRQIGLYTKEGVQLE